LNPFGPREPLDGGPVAARVLDPCQLGEDLRVVRDLAGERSEGRARALDQPGHAVRLGLAQPPGRLRAEWLERVLAQRGLPAHVQDERPADVAAQLRDDAQGPRVDRAGHGPAAVARGGVGRLRPCGSGRERQHRHDACRPPAHARPGDHRGLPFSDRR